MSEVSRNNEDDTFFVRNVFLPSGRMTAVTRSFLNESAEHASFHYVSQRSAMLSYEELQAANGDGTLKRIHEMAKNYEQPLFPSGIVHVHIGAAALRLSFEMKPAAESQMKIFGDRLRSLESDELEPNLATDVITVRTTKMFAPSEEKLEQARHEFEAVMQDEYVFRGYFFRSMGIGVASMDKDVG